MWLSFFALPYNYNILWSFFDYVMLMQEKIPALWLICVLERGSLGTRLILEVICTGIGFEV